MQYSGPGLLTGKCGKALFLFYYSKFANNKNYSIEAADLIVDIFHSIKQGFDFPTFCDGIAGYMWTVEHLIQHNFISREDVPFLNDWDEILYKQMTREIRSGNYDFLHGAIGYGIYFVNRLHNKACVVYLTEFINDLEKQSKKGKDGEIMWESMSETTGTVGCNFGLAHGMPSIIVFLSKTFISGHNKEKALQLLIGSVNYLLNRQLDRSNYDLNFPNWFFDDNTISIDRKIGWCYGDMGVGFAIYRAGDATLNNDWKTIGLKILLDTTYLKNTEKENITDPYLCHGTAGIAHMYNRIYLETKIEPFKNAALYWFNETFKERKLNNL